MGQSTWGQSTTGRQTPPSLQDASRGIPSSTSSSGAKKAEPQGAAELPQGSVGGPPQGRGAEEAEGETVLCKADHGEGPVRQTLDAEQVHLQLKPWGKVGRRQDQAKECVSGIVERRLPVKKTTNTLVDLIHVTGAFLTRFQVQIHFSLMSCLYVLHHVLILSCVQSIFSTL